MIKTDNTKEEFAGDQLWRLLQTTSRPTCKVNYPRKDPGDRSSMGKIIMRLLSQAEQTACAVAAHDYALKAIKQDNCAAYEDVYRMSAQLEILHRACFSAEILKEEEQMHPFFPPVPILRKTLTEDETQYLIGAYLGLQTDKGAIRETVSEDDLFFWCHSLNTEGAASLAPLSHDGIMALILAMAKRIQELENGQTL